MAERVGGDNAHRFRTDGLGHALVDDILTGACRYIGLTFFPAPLSCRAKRGREVRDLPDAPSSLLRAYR
jgi:hypothetical protein